MTRHLSVEQVISLHQGLTGLLSGDPGIRDLRTLDAAVLKPTLVFDGEDLYPTLAAKAAALLHALVTTAPFVTASKGTAALAAECFLAANGVGLTATDRRSCSCRPQRNAASWGSNPSRSGSRNGCSAARRALLNFSDPDARVSLQFLRHLNRHLRFQAQSSLARALLREPA